MFTLSAWDLRALWDPNRRTAECFCHWLVRSFLLAAQLRVGKCLLQHTVKNPRSQSHINPSPPPPRLSLNEPEGGVSVPGSPGPPVQAPHTSPRLGSLTLGGCRFSEGAEWTGLCSQLTPPVPSCPRALELLCARGSTVPTQARDRGLRCTGLASRIWGRFLKAAYILLLPA